MTDAEFWALERRLWLEGVDLYNQVLDPACLMAFPGAGVLDAPAVLDALRHAPRWASVEFAGEALARAGGAVVVLGYAATARHGEEGSPFCCLCTTTYRRDGGGWRLVQHQQTLVLT